MNWAIHDGDIQNNYFMIIKTLSPKADIRMVFEIASINPFCLITNLHMDKKWLQMGLLVCYTDFEH